MPNSEDEQADTAVNKNMNKQSPDMKVILDSTNDTSKRKIHKLMKADIRETIEKKSKEQRVNLSLPPLAPSLIQTDILFLCL